MTADGRGLGIIGRIRATVRRWTRVAGLPACLRSPASWGSRSVMLRDGFDQHGSRRAARAGDGSPAVRVADHQTAGRGRLDRRWEDDGRSQLKVVSVPSRIEPGLIAGTIAAAARGAAAHGADLGFKWPNDLMIETSAVSGKVAGVLAEYVADPAVVVVGIGLNLHPPGIPGAASLAEVGCLVSRDQLLASMLNALPHLLARPDLVRTELVEHSVTIGRRVRVERPGSELIGTATGLDEQGRLLLEVDGEVEIISVGDIVHLRPIDS